MIDLSNIKYYVIALGSDGKPVEITDFVSRLTWSEGKGELAMKAQFDARNDETSLGTISEIVKPGTVVIILSTTSEGTQEVFRGKLEVWNPVTSYDECTFRGTCYDDLFPTQKSEDNFFVKKHTRSYKAIRKLFREWSIPIGIYNGPSRRLPKMIFQATPVADIANKMLKKAYDLGDNKCFLRAKDGVIDILPYYDNYDIYFFNGDNSIRIDEKQSTENLITRVKIMNKSGKRMKAKVDGLTEYGIRQKIMNMEMDDKLSDKKTEAEQLLDEKGVIERTITLECPDMPTLRRGDVIYCDIGTSVGYFDVAGVTHNARDAKMTLDLEYSDKNALEGGEVKRKKKYVKGDIVTFLGGECHLSAKGSSKSYDAVSGRAKITRISKKKAYPYRLMHTNVSSTVNGWVTEDQFY